MCLIQSKRATGVKPYSLLLNNERPLLPDRKTRQTCLSLFLLNIILLSTLTKGYWTCQCVCVTAVTGCFIPCYFRFWCSTQLSNYFFSTYKLTVHLVLVSYLLTFLTTNKYDFYSTMFLQYSRYKAQLCLSKLLKNVMSMALSQEAKGTYSMCFNRHLQICRCTWL